MTGRIEYVGCCLTNDQMTHSALHIITSSYKGTKMFTNYIPLMHVMGQLIINMILSRHPTPHVIDLEALHYRAAYLLAGHSCTQKMKMPACRTSRESMEYKTSQTTLTFVTLTHMNLTYDL